MTIKLGTNLRGTYSNGINTLHFSGTVESIHTDTASGGFSVARIQLDKPVGFSWESTKREALLMTMIGDEKHDDRFDVKEIE